MMDIEFVKLSPTRNMTVLVKTPVPRDKQALVGQLIMDYSNVYAEQVGFLEKPENPKAAVRLQMAAGEFCGNGTMAAAAYLALKNGINAGESVDIPMEVSGADDLLVCRIKADEKGYTGTVAMPLPLDVRDCRYEIGGREYSLSTVFLPGIRHIILPIDEIGSDFRNILETSADELKKQIEDEAFGIIVYDKINSRIDPLVIVKASHSMCWEGGCGSGSEALGIYLACLTEGSVEIPLKQPGGTITVNVKYDKGIKAVSITGKVTVAAEGTAYIDL
ncbi:MAG: hypothetical protein PUD43_08705 [Clostridia bacterium]|nr:hypothetical protein [Clostridia bacterium]